ncbi:MAG: DUF3990 domain-containing protein, partial [Deltaproteobacteria bacterium]|nr:DUF3990 domain-containing protein [Deltaproteobacteria bacterium]
MTIKIPDVSKGQNPLDFGQGFYLTSNRRQARQWAIKKANRLKTGLPVINIFTFDDRTDFSPLSVKIFEGPNEEWLDFVVANRNETYRGRRFDIIIG